VPTLESRVVLRTRGTGYFGKSILPIRNHIGEIVRITTSTSPRFQLGSLPA
jgi:hypothetical protein